MKARIEPTIVPTNSDRLVKLEEWSAEWVGVAAADNVGLVLNRSVNDEAVL